MRTVILAPAAEEDIRSILAWSREMFGEPARQRYAALLSQAIVDVAADPFRAGVHEADDVSPGLRIYHVTHSRRRRMVAASRVVAPRHFLLFRLRHETRLEVVRVLHDSMQLSRHVPRDAR